MLSTDGTLKIDCALKLNLGTFALSLALSLHNKQERGDNYPDDY